ncbi:hypothetical protein [Rhodococcus sp. SBT000017]|uniref:hypothetical protein n=1 Tax=Rhodococcus sp. SBT000017 TaxID=1803385 RepID=UPI0011C46F66|nr:hypothetical protein [Rhodococcus sp. SBT000017]
MDAKFVLTALAAVFSGLGLLVMGRQLEIARNTAGGRGMNIEATRGGIVSSVNGGAPTVQVFCKVELIGPGVRHNVDVRVLGLGCDPIGMPPTRPIMTCESEPIEWGFDAEVDLVRHAYFMVSWVDPYGEGLRTNAIAKNIPDDGLYLWEWNRFFRLRLWWESKRGMSPEPLGRWRRYRDHPLQKDHGPIGLLPNQPTGAKRRLRPPGPR